MNQAIIELTTPDISCDKCTANIEGDLASYPGIKQVTVDVATRRVHVAYDQQRTSPDQLRARAVLAGARSGRVSRWHWQVLAGYNVSMLFMVIEHYSYGPEPVYQRAAERGRMLPDGLRYVDSWIVDDGRLDRCFQLMETSNPELLDVWRDRWADLCDFETFPVIKSDEAARRTGVRWDMPGR